MSQPDKHGLTFEFEEVPLVVGRIGALGVPEGSVPLRIALISGSCDISFAGKGESLSWDIQSVTLSSPIKDDPDTVIRYVRVGQTGRELWDFVTQSIVAAKAHDIAEAIEGRE